VLGSVSAVFLAIHAGFRNTLLVGGAFYILAILFVGGRRTNLPARPASALIET
jgi:hypothetical protein